MFRLSEVKMKGRYLILSGVLLAASISGSSGLANAQYPYCDPYCAFYYGCDPYAYPYPVAYDPYYYGAPIAAAAIGTGLAFGAAYHWGHGYWGRGHGHWGQGHYGGQVSHHGGGMRGSGPGGMPGRG